MPPKKRPIEKADTVEETAAQPARNQRAKKNDTDKKDEVFIESKAEKKVESKKDTKLLTSENVVKKRGAHLPSEDFISNDDASQEPDKKKKRGNTKETKGKTNENINGDDAEKEQKKTKKAEKKTKQTEKETPEMKESDRKDAEETVNNTKRKITKQKSADTPVEDGTEEPDKKKKKGNQKEIKQKPDANNINDNNPEQKKPKKAENKATQNNQDKETPEVEDTKSKRTLRKKNETKTEDDPEKANNKSTKTEKKGAEKAKKTTDKKEKPPKKEPLKRKASSDVDEEKKTVNSTETKWEKIHFNSVKKNAEGDVSNLKIMSWNVNGLRSWCKKDGMNIFAYAAPDILCLQETKCNEESLPKEISSLEGYEKYLCSSDKNGYAGVAIFTKEKPVEVIYGINNEEQDEDGRCITVEFEKYYLVTVYVPNAGRKLVTLDKRLDWNEAFKKFIKDLDGKKPVIICGDMNVAHNEIDLKNPKTNTKNAGFTQEERDGMTDFLEEGFIDTFRALYPDKTDSYTFWTYMMDSRKKNIGWRLDYFLVSERIKDKVCDNLIHDKVFGSDHCPVTLFVNI